MENMFIGVVLLSAHIFTVSSAPIAPVQNNCAEGEPLQGETQPDVNITIIPSLTITALSSLAILCDANVARFPSNSTPAPTNPVKITIHVGNFNVQECKNNGGIFQCFYTLDMFFPGMPQTVSCTASAEDGQCRFKTANVTLSTNPTVPPSVMPFPGTNVTNVTTLVFKNGTNVTTTAVPTGNGTTASPVTNVSTAAVTPQRNLTTAVPTGSGTTSSPVTGGITTPRGNVTSTAGPSTPPTLPPTPPVATTEQVTPPIPTATPTPTPTEDDDDDDDDDSDDESDDSDSDSGSDSD